MEIIAKLLVYSAFVIYEYKIDFADDDEAILKGIYIYFTQTDIYHLIFFQFFYFILIFIIINSSVVLMIYYLRPNHMVITDELLVYGNFIFFEEVPNKYYTLIPFVFQIIALIFYLEILELNFWKLNYNTIKNIQAREGKEIEKDEKDLDLKSAEKNTIELSEQYYTLCKEPENNEEKSEDLKSNNSDADVNSLV